MVAEWNNFVNQLLLPYNYDMVFEPVSGSSMDTYFFNMLELSPKKWSFGVGFELDKKVLDLDFVELKKDLDASSNKPAWYKQFTQGLDRVVEKQKVKVLDGTGQPQKGSDGKEVYQEQKDANGETLKDENGNVMYVEKEVEIEPKVPGVNEQGKWQGTVSQFKTFLLKH
ncbi:hypothetical protein HGD80_03250 [Paulownia witches'-broom phytoplasma]|nr:hypothetical protein [Paulownia witches'-broom phytoplasma]QYC30794.1 hypothetical protein HGD80_03250 [Paulownia witches'-broom phytoplasma]GLH60664.1 hypothetical protein PAWBP_4020 [Paulownia witches'-broom phytoplasma]